MAGETTPGAPAVKPIVSRAASARLKGTTGNGMPKSVMLGRGTLGPKQVTSGEGKFGARPVRY